MFLLCDNKFFVAEILFQLLAPVTFKFWYAIFLVSPIHDMQKQYIKHDPCKNCVIQIFTFFLETVNSNKIWAVSAKKVQLRLHRKRKKEKVALFSGSSMAMLNAVGLQADLDHIKHSQAEKSFKLVFIKCLIRHSDLNHQVLKQFCFSWL